MEQRTETVTEMITTTADNMHSFLMSMVKHIQRLEEEIANLKEENARLTRSNSSEP